MNVCNTPQFREDRRRGLALPALGRSAFAAEPLKVGFIYLGPIGDFGWTWAHDKGRKAHARRAQGPGRRRLCRERQGRRERDPDHQGPRPAGHTS